MFDHFSKSPGHSTRLGSPNHPKRYPKPQSTSPPGDPPEEAKGGFKKLGLPVTVESTDIKK